MFVDKRFTSHSGLSLGWKIDCDSLTAEDYECIAKVVAGKVRFNEVIGIPSGGLALAEALRPYADPAAEKALIVDDVLTTGKSMEEMRTKLTAGKHPLAVNGVVLFARTPHIPLWIVPVFVLGAAFME